MTREEKLAEFVAYSFDANKDPLTQLLALNLDVAKRIEANQPVTAPGELNDYPNAKELVTDDFIRV